MSLIVSLLVAFGLLLLAGIAFQLAGSAIDRHLHRPPGRLMGTPGARLHVYEEGTGEPTIILESGIAASSLNWRALQSRLARIARVISYDRAGFGWSDAPSSPRTIANISSELEQLLHGTVSSGPVILVAHSFGSLIARDLARRCRERVCGIVLLDPIDCRHWQNLSPEEQHRLDLGVRFSRRGALLAHLGVVRFALLLVIAGARALPKSIARATSGAGAAVISRIAEEVGKMPREVWPAVRSHWSRPESFETLAAYLTQLTACTNEIPYDSLGDLPLIVVTAEKASASEFDEHRRLAALSTQAEHIVAKRSGHWVQLDRPDLAVDAVRRLIQKHRHNEELTHV